MVHSEISFTEKEAESEEIQRPMRKWIEGEFEIS